VRSAYECPIGNSLSNKWLASAVSFGVITVFFLCMFIVLPRPLPASEGILSMPWWAPLGGLVGAVQVYAGLTLVNKVRAGPFIGFTVTAALITTLVIDHFGWFRMEVHAINRWRAVGALLMIGEITCIAKN